MVHHVCSFCGETFNENESDTFNTHWQKCMNDYDDSSDNEMDKLNNFYEYGDR